MDPTPWSSLATDVGKNLINVEKTKKATTKVLGPKLFFVTDLVQFVTAVARLVCPDLLG